MATHIFVKTGLVGVCALFVACGPPRDEPTIANAASHDAQALWSNGDFEADAIGATPPAGWTSSHFINAGVLGTASAPPSSYAALGLTKVGASKNETFVVGGAAMTQSDPDLGSGQSFRFPIFGSRAARLNYKDATDYGKNSNASVIQQTQTMTVSDIDPNDNLMHLRFAVAPVLEVPSHSYNQQPYYYVELKNLTTGKQIFAQFNVAGQAGVPWHTTTSILTGNTTQWLDWQVIDIAPGSAAIGVGDSVQLTVVASGCSPGGHFGRIYVDGIGPSLPGLSASATGPVSATAGSNITYTIRYSNGGSSAVSGAHVDLTTPPNTTFQSTSLGAACTAPAADSAGTVSCPLGTLAAGSGGAFTATLKINSGTTGAVASGNYAIGGINAPTLLGPKVTTTIPAAATTADIVLTKTTTVSSIAPGTVFSSGSPLYTITVTNNSTTTQLRNSTGTAPSVTDIMPTQLSGATWSCAVTAQGSGTGTASKCKDTSSGGSSSLSNQTGNISVTPRLGYGGGQVTFTVWGTVTGTGSITNTVSASAGGGINDPNMANNSATVTTPIGVLRTLALSKTDGAGNGIVRSAPSGVSCDSSCTSTTGSYVDGAQVLLTAAPVPGASFTQWSGACAGSAQSCLVTMNGNQAVTATFAPAASAGAAANLYVYRGDNQAALTLAQFTSPLQVLVTDAAGLPKPGVSVSFTAVLVAAPRRRSPARRRRTPRASRR